MMNELRKTSVDMPTWRHETCWGGRHHIECAWVFRKIYMLYTYIYIYIYTCTPSVRSDVHTYWFLREHLFIPSCTDSVLNTVIWCTWPCTRSVFSNLNVSSIKKNKKSVWCNGVTWDALILICGGVRIVLLPLTTNPTLQNIQKQTSNVIYAATLCVSVVFFFSYLFLRWVKITTDPYKYTCNKNIHF